MSTRKRSAKEAEIQEFYDQRKRLRETKKFPRVFDVVFRNIQFDVTLTANMTIGDAKNKIKKRMAMFVKDKSALDVDNDNLRFTDSMFLGRWPDDVSDSEYLSNFFIFDDEHSQKKCLKIAELFGMTLTTPNSQNRYGLCEWSSDEMRQLHRTASKLAGFNGLRYEEHWFNIYRKCDDGSWKRIRKVGYVGDQLSAGDELEMKCEHVRVGPNAYRQLMTVSVGTLTGDTFTVQTLANGQEKVEDFRALICLQRYIPSSQQKRVVLLCQRRLMTDGTILNDYGMGNGSTIYLTYLKRAS